MDITMPDVLRTIPSSNRYARIRAIRLSSSELDFQIRRGDVALTLSRAEIAQAVGFSDSAAGKRYIRGLERLKQVLAHHPAHWNPLPESPRVPTPP